MRMTIAYKFHLLHSGYTLGGGGGGGMGGLVLEHTM